MNASSGPIGLLAGSGRFPVVFAERARGLAGLVGRFYWAGVARLSRMIRCFKREGVQRIVMAGKIHKSVIFRPWFLLRLLPDWRTLRLWWRRSRRDNKDDTLLLTVIEEFATEGLRFDSALDICPELLVKTGVL